ncbi:TonB-dependent receptor [Myroides guanonis]|uniref:Iron complex outermembrane recepter protein n=1 Tax=Myroides guanonis TaxID=1150112 RepID=A0A1I3MNG6_9FLAO|nr:TonB-dependent receptor [Myroides guanonis]SFI98481.1 iron complex outermembrane recepter protein [Myroides guanonis]
MKLLQSILLTLFVISLGFGQTGIVKGKVVDENNKPIGFVTVYVNETNIGVHTNDKGEYKLQKIGNGTHTINAVLIGYESVSRILVVKENETIQNFTLKASTNELDAIELYSRSNKNEKKVQNLTRLPLKIKDQVQSISIVSDAVIKEQGALSITDAARNVAGVTQFASYGGVRESMSIRGYRGTPVLRNGVVMDSDFRTGAGVVDMQGIESIQVIKGSAAIGQGIGNGLGSAGGVINMVTKTPNFRNQTEVAFRTGSWNQIRPTIDFEQILDKAKTVSFRFNGAYEKGDGFRKNVEHEKFYVNPSLEWRPDDKTSIILEMDYLNSDATPDNGTVNLGPDSQNGLYKMPKDNFLGFKENNYNVKAMTYTARVQRQLTDKLSLNVTSVTSNAESETLGLGLSIFKNTPELRARNVSKSYRDDKNSLFQIDLVGRDIQTGFLKHTFQIGFDYREGRLGTETFKTFKDGVEIDKGKYVDVVDVTKPIDNDLPSDVRFEGQGEVVEVTPTIGFMVQDYLHFSDQLKLMLGIRYSRMNGNMKENATIDRWNPLVGIILSPTENINTFVSYTTTTNLRTSSNALFGGGFAGASDTKQLEFGFKSDWLNERLGVNFTYFFINNSGLSAQYYENNLPLDKTFILAGDLKRNGFELDVTGRITNNLEVMLGYANLIARYTDSPAYVEGSAPMNAPEHTANGWLHYRFLQGALKGLSIGAGAYFVGERPVNEHQMVSDGHGTEPGVKPFDMPDYTTVNAQIGYAYKGASLRVFFNNIFDKTGYTSYYRGGYINETDPRNVAVQLSYKF